MGIIYPASGGLEQEFWKFIPGGVTIFMTRLTTGSGIVEKLTVEALLEMNQILKEYRFAIVSRRGHHHQHVLGNDSRCCRLCCCDSYSQRCALGLQT